MAKQNLLQRAVGLCEANVSQGHGYHGCSEKATLEVTVPVGRKYVFPQGLRVCKEHAHYPEEWRTPVETKLL